MPERYEYKVGADEAGQRLDLFLAKRNPKFSRSHHKNQINEERVKVNSEVEFHPQYKVKKGDMIEEFVEDLKDPKHVVASEGEFDIVYEDGNLLVINKASGVVVHPGSAHHNDTLANFVKYYLQDKGEDRFGVERVGMIHRLDKPTSGLILFAKTPETLWYISKQFADRKVKKTYLALVEGQTPQSFSSFSELGRDKNNRQKFSSNTNKGKPASTDFELITSGIVNTTSKNRGGKNRGLTEIYSLLLAKPRTGRTHQIRVHLREAGFPIVGDRKYGGRMASRLMLHAYKLELSTRTDSGKKNFIAKPGQDFMDELKTRNISFSP